MKTIDERIAVLQQKLVEVKGTRCEVYARIVGYYRAINNWNIGKKAEWKQRINYSMKSLKNRKPVTKNKTIDEHLKDVAAAKRVAGGFHHYKLFYRPTCPNCPAVKAIMKSTALEGTEVNAEENIEEAMKLNMYSVPTVIFFDAQDTEIARASQIVDLKAVLATI